MSQIDNLIEINYLKKESKKVKIIEWIVISLFTVYLTFTLYIFYSFVYSSTSQPTIIYNNLTEEQINHIESILDDIDYFWINSAKKITFTGNKKDLEEGKGGTNIFKRIIVLYDEKDYILRMRLCHEAIHTFSPNEDIAYKLGDELYCFK